MHLIVTNYRGIRKVDWSPSGVCLLVGPNGAGKSTVLDVLQVLRYTFLRSLPEAIRLTGGPDGLKHQDAEEAPSLEIGVGDASWSLAIGTDGPNVHPAAREMVRVGERVLLRRELYSPVFVLEERERPADDERAGLRVLADNEPPEAIEPLLQLLRDIRCYRFYAIDQVRREGSPNGDDMYLQANGYNVLTVLRNWSSSRRYRDQYNAVLQGLRQIFPRMFADLDISAGAPRLWASFYRPGHEQGLSIRSASDGFLASMMLLTAVTGAKDGSVVMIDEIEDSMHPAAIRGILDIIRRRADEHALTVLITTHSPVVIDLFDDTPEQVYVMEEGRAELPVAITALHDKDWLAHFRLGRLYGREFGVQPSAEEA